MEKTVERYFDEIVRSIQESVAFDSSQKPAGGNFPFGKETADCLNHFLSLAEKMGFETHNYDNYVGEVIFGSGEELAILAHLDVVPAGSGWKYPPFSGVVNDDVSEGGVKGKKIWGRGTMDDKGPAITTLYCLKALKDEGFAPKRKIKLIVGCNEESGWACIDHYLKVAHMPDEGFSPDADFPAIYAEKGILHFTAEFPLSSSALIDLKAGEQANMVCDSARAVLRADLLSALKGYKTENGSMFTIDPAQNAVHFTGKSAHGSTPNAGINALGGLLGFLKDHDDGIKKAHDVLFQDVLSLKAMNDETGHLTMSPDVAWVEDNTLFITTDIRYPATHKKEEILSALDGANVRYKIRSHQAPLYNDPNGTLISTLMGVYNDVAGTNDKPIAIGGGTYARALKCGCGFGPELPNEEATIHQSNEYLTFDRIEFMFKIYYLALKKLCE